MFKQIFHKATFVVIGILIFSLSYPVLVTQFVDTASYQDGETMLQQSYGKLPLSFEANNGQVDSQVKFLSRGDGYTLFLTPSEAVLSLRKPSESQKKEVDLNSPVSSIASTSSMDQAVLRMQLVGANSAPRVSGLEELPGKVNYFIGNDPSKWRTNVSTFAKVKYQSLYPGIDLVYYGNQGQLEYDFVIAPGADPNAIVLAFEGADNIKVDTDGNLLLNVKNEQIQMQRPLIYQGLGNTRQEVSGTFLVRDNQQIGFHVDAYDVTRPLIIDPVLTYSTYLGGSGFDAASAIAVDSQGNAYITGTTSSSDFPTANAIDYTLGGLRDAFITKIDASGSAIVYSTFLGGDNDASHETFQDVKVDLMGNVYAAGYTTADDFPIINAFQGVSGGGYDAVIVKLDSTGSSLIYSTYLGGTGSEQAKGIAINSGYEVFVVGITTSANFPSTIGAYQPARNGPSDAFITKLNASGTGLLFSTYLGGNYIDAGNDITLDTSGNSYVTGRTVSANFPTTLNAYQTIFLGDSNSFIDDAFITKINPNGSGLVYSTYLGGSTNERGYSIAVDYSNNVYVVGNTDSTNFPTANALQSNFQGAVDVFITMLDQAGSSLVFSTYLGGSGFETSRAMSLDNTGNIHLAGYTSSSNFPLTNPIQSSLSGSTDAFVVKLNPTGSAYIYSTYLGGNSNDGAEAIAIDIDRNAYIAGGTISSNFPLVNPLQPNLFGGQEAFVVKFGELPPNQPPTVSAGDSFDVNEGNSINVLASGSDPENEPLTFAWDLDNNGSFETPGQSSIFSAAGLDGPSNHTITVQVTDSGGLSATDQATVEVLNVAPTAIFNAPASVNEGDYISLSLTNPFDPSSADTATGLEYAFDCGDGAGLGAFSASNTAVCPTDDNGARSVRAQIRDKDGGLTEYSTSVAVNNVAPSVDSLTGPVDPVNINDQATYSVDVTFSDPAGVYDEPYTCVFDMDYDGANFDADATISGVTGTSCSTPLNYTDPGVYKVRVAVTDKDSGTGSGTATEFIVVYDPEGGFATGGGWIVPGGQSSDPGDLLPGLNGSSKANFGFVVKYKSGASTVPSGNLEFHYNVSDLHLHSSGMEWLVVTNSQWAHFHGTGEIDGMEGLYPFRVDARDNTIDRFVIKIWAPGADLNLDDPIYKASGDLEGGQIKIHKN